MSKVLGFIMKNVLTESVIKHICGWAGDYLVNSTKNSLDNKLWAKVKKSLDI